MLERYSSGPVNPVIAPRLRELVSGMSTEKHPRTICIINYKGGVGKTTVTTLLGYFLADKRPAKKVLLVDIDAQCSLSLALGFEPEEVSGGERTIYNLVRPSRWAKLNKTDLVDYVRPTPGHGAPKNLYCIPGSFETEELDADVVREIVGSKSRGLDDLVAHCRSIFARLRDYDYVLIDCPPNKMFLTQAMLRASTFYLMVTIPDRISAYGMPRLLNWVRKIPDNQRPVALGYILNLLNRTGGGYAGMVFSQWSSRDDLRARLPHVVELGEIPRLDVVARFLGDRQKFTWNELSVSNSGQPSVSDCMSSICNRLFQEFKRHNG